VAPKWPLTPDRRSVVDVMVASLIYPIGHDDIEDEDTRSDGEVMEKLREMQSAI